MILDSSLELADAQSVAAAAGTALIGSQIDQWASEMTPGTNIGLVIKTTTGIITGGSAGKVRFQLASSATAAIPTDGTATVLYQTPDFVTGSATLPANTILFACQLPKVANIVTQNLRFLGILCVTTTTTTTAGAIDAFLTEDVGFWAANATTSN